jgi:tripartite-type tricarboxylate transporter receptor subunit TctC
MTGHRAIARLRAWTLAAAFACAALSPAAAQDYPTRQVTIIVTVAAGSQSDIFARAIAEPLAQRLGKPVVIENRPGGGQIIGAQAGAKAAPDGYTLLHGNLSGLVISPQLRNPVPYTVKDFAPITVTYSGPSVLVVDPKLPIKTAAELVAYAKANPGKLNYGSHGAGSFTHVSTEMLKGLTGIDMVHIPYNGGGPLTIGFLSGSVQVVIFDLVSVRAHVEAGKARVIAQVGEKRSPLYPDVPLLSETLDPALANDFWLGMVAPAGTPPAIVEKVSADIAAVVKQPDVRDQLVAMGLEVVGSTPAEFAAYIRSESEKWGRVIRDANVKAE